MNTRCPSSSQAPPRLLVHIDGLAGNEVFVRKSASYYESLVALNQRFAAQGSRPVNIKLAPEDAGGR